MGEGLFGKRRLAGMRVMRKADNQWSGPNEDIASETLETRTSRQCADHGDLLKEKAREVQEVLSQFLKGVALYVAITGALLKFSLDKNATPELRLALSILGILVSLVGFGSCIFSRRYQTAAANDIRALSAAAGVQDFTSNLLPFQYMTWLLLGFLSIATCGWVYLILQGPR